MRLKIARTLGFRKWSVWPTFAFLESKANDVRGGSPLRRRTLILGSLAAASGAVGTGMFGGQSAAAGGHVSARSVDVGAVLARSRTARLAASQHGAVMSAEVVSQGGSPITVLYHERDRAITILDASKAEDPAALRLRPTKAGDVSYELVNTTDVLGKTRVDGTYVKGSSRFEAEVSPAAKPSRARCAAACVFGQTGPRCRTECTNCGTAILGEPTGGTLAAFGVACLKCYACAGLTVYTCVKTCFK